nr:minichromosome maintenance protein MCM [Halorussus pelagicus]
MAWDESPEGTHRLYQQALECVTDEKNTIAGLLFRDLWNRQKTVNTKSDLFNVVLSAGVGFAACIEISENARDSFTNQFQSLTESFSDRDSYHEMVPKPTVEAVARTADALARLRLSETVIPDDVARATDLHESVLDRICHPEPDDEYDADTVETGRSKTQRDRIKNLKHLITEIEEDYCGGAPIHEVMVRADEIGMEQSKVEHEIDKLKHNGELYEPSTDHLRTT